ncbi:TetR family transcriptional regulator [Sphingobium lactosutens]|uniref:TetR family transcriptional regulator n=1 Tax=Sphingobium lactosutens TaxID=522773 RepID=UPI0015BACF27|nr:TetR family transcriptional regulator [Sphingobium lactosutens]NWK95768.1 TetR family transcriptional regulator [Sphingobium lactosutens]
MPDRKLTRDTIAAAALEILNEQGLDQLSLRKLAARLEVKAPSLYWHVADKNALLALLAESVFTDCLAQIPPSDDWRGWLHAFGLALWRAQNGMRDAGRLILMTGQEEAVLARMEQAIVAPLTALGLSAAQAVSMQASVQALVTGWTTFAQGPNAAYLHAHMSIDAAFQQGLDALLNGFDPIR